MSTSEMIWNNLWQKHTAPDFERLKEHKHPTAKSFVSCEKGRWPSLSKNKGNITIHLPIYNATKYTRYSPHTNFQLQYYYVLGSMCTTIAKAIHKFCKAASLTKCGVSSEYIYIKTYLQATLLKCTYTTIYNTIPF